MTVSDHLSPEQADAVRALIRATEHSDGVPAVSEQFLLRLDDPAGTALVWHAMHTTAGELDGYAVADRATPPSGELVVATGARRRGIATGLLQELRAATGQPMHLWAHGDLAAARGFAAAVGAREIRSLLELRRPAGPVDVPAPADGVSVRTFRPGEDDATWLAVNAAAFATHPEQGRMSQRDLDERMAEDWFDPAGFFIAERAGQIIGFHWTKVHGPDLGEVYVVGVHPDAQGLGLGKLLTATGLAHLTSVGVPEISLFVDGDNTTAVALYEGLGFTRHRADTQWATA